MLRGARGGSSNGRGRRGGGRKDGGQNRTVVREGFSPSEGGIRKSNRGRGRGGGGQGGGGGRGRGRGSSQNRRGGSGGRGGGRSSRGRGQRSGKPKTQADLDAEMDAYFLKDQKTGGTHLDADLDNYFANQQKKDDDATGAEDQEAPAAAAEPEIAAES